MHVKSTSHGEGEYHVWVGLRATFEPGKIWDTLSKDDRVLQFRTEEEALRVYTAILQAVGDATPAAEEDVA